jgi:hypothetical protein
VLPYLRAAAATVGCGCNHRLLVKVLSSPRETTHTHAPRFPRREVSNEPVACLGSGVRLRVGVRQVH